MLLIRLHLKLHLSEKTVRYPTQCRLLPKAILRASQHKEAELILLCSFHKSPPPNESPLGSIEPNFELTFMSTPSFLEPQTLKM